MVCECVMKINIVGGFLLESVCNFWLGAFGALHLSSCHPAPTTNGSASCLCNDAAVFVCFLFKRESFFSTGGGW